MEKYYLILGGFRMKKKVILNDKMMDFVKNEKFLLKSYDELAFDQTGKHVHKQPETDKKVIQELYVMYIAEQLGIEVKDFDEAMKTRALVYRQWDYEHNGDKRREHVRNTSKKKKKTEEKEERLRKQASIIHMDCSKPGFSQSYFDKFIIPAAKEKSKKEEQETAMKDLVKLQYIMNREEFFSIISPEKAYSEMNYDEKSWIESLFIRYVNIKLETKCNTIYKATEVAMEAKSVRASNGTPSSYHPHTIPQIPNTVSTVGYKKKGPGRPKVFADSRNGEQTRNDNKLIKLISEWFELYVDWSKVVSVPVLTLPSFNDMYKSIIIEQWRLVEGDVTDAMVEYLYKKYLNIYRCHNRTYLQQIRNN